MKVLARKSAPPRTPFRGVSLATGLQVALGVACILFAFRSPLLDIYRLSTRSPDLGYVWLVPFLAAYLAWIRRIRWRTWHHQSSWIGVAVIIFSLMLSWTGRYYDILTFWHIGAPLAVLGLLVSIFGVGIWRAFAPAFIMLCAITPAPGVLRRQLAVPLQNLASHITTFILELFNVPVQAVGNLIEINGVAVAVGEACNGMKLILPLLLIIFTLVFSLSLKAGARTALIIVSVPLAILVNVIRLLPTSIAYGYFPDRAEIVYQISGLVMIPMAIIMTLGLLRLLEAIDIPVARWRLVTS